MPAPAGLRLIPGVANMNFSVMEVVLIFGAVLLIFGPSKLPQLGEAIGKSIRNFRKATTQDNEIDVTPRRDGLPPASDQTSVADEARSSQKA